jgi:hypothetical protein
VHNHQSQALLPLWLPVAVAQNLHVLLDLEEPFLRFGKLISSPQKISSNGLCVSSTQKTAWHKIVGKARGVRGMGDKIRAGHERSRPIAPV